MRLRHFAALALLAAMCACTGGRQLTKEDVRSELISAASLASATEVLLERMQQGAIATQFVSAHIEYLREQLADSEKSLHKQAAADAAAAAEQCRDGLSQLGDELSQLKPNAEANELRAAKFRVAKIREALVIARASL
jgi:hypothetical protein